MTEPDQRETDRNQPARLHHTEDTDDSAKRKKKEKWQPVLKGQQIVDEKPEENQQHDLMFKKWTYQIELLNEKDKQPELHFQAEKSRD